MWEFTRQRGSNEIMLLDALLEIQDPVILKLNTYYSFKRPTWWFCITYQVSILISLPYRQPLFPLFPIYHQNQLAVNISVPFFFNYIFLLLYYVRLSSIKCETDLLCSTKVNSQNAPCSQLLYHATKIKLLINTKTTS